MERLDRVVARVLAGLRVMTEEEEAGGHVDPRQLAEAGGGDKAPRLAIGRSRHHRSPSRTVAKRAATTNAKRETTAP